MVTRGSILSSFKNHPQGGWALTRRNAGVRDGNHATPVFAASTHVRTWISFVRS